MKKIILFLSVSLFLLGTCACKKSSDLPRAIDPAMAPHADKLWDAAWGVATDEMHGLLVVKDGKVVYDRRDPAHGPETLHSMWSASKTFTATAVGFARQDGLLSVDDPLVRFLKPEEIPDSASEYLGKVTVKHLLTMSAGLKEDYIGRSNGHDDFDWALETLKGGFEFEPGTTFRYNSMETYLLSLIVSRVTGKTVEDYLEDKFFAPLGIREHVWEKSPQGYSAGGWGLYLRLDDFAKLGQFFLQKGEWKGKQLLDPAWFDEAMSKQVMQPGEYTPDDEWMQGYGYQMWCCSHGAYRADGAWGQICMIIPEKDALVVWQGRSRDVGMEFATLWKEILPYL